MPRVSIGIPAYERPDMVVEAIRSVLRQSFADFEIVVSDDSPSDHVGQAVSSMVDRRVKYHRNTTPLGVPGNWNRSVRLAAGELFGVLPDDDVYLSDFLSKMVTALDACPDVGFAMCGFYNIDQQLRPLHENLVSQSRFVAKGEEAVRLLLTSMVQVPASLLFRRKVMLDMGLWREDYLDDWAFILRVAYRHGFVFVPQLLSGVRFHPARLSRVMAEHGGVLGEHGRDDVLTLINQVFDVFGEALPATLGLLSLRAAFNRELSQACMLKALKAILRCKWPEALLQLRRAHLLFPLAGLDLAFVALWRKHRFYAKRAERWERGYRLSDEPVVPLERSRHQGVSHRST